jgi:sugar porter (SP) family MFS transporter
LTQTPLENPEDELDPCLTETPLENSEGALDPSDNSSFVYLVAGMAALAGLLFGFDTGVISGAILFIRAQFALSDAAVGLVVSGVLFGATFSSIVSGWLSDIFGRKKVIFATAIIFAIGSIVSALAQSVEVLVIGRVTLGLAIGVASFTAPLYISEVSPRSQRGALVGLNQLAITIGIFGSYIVDFLFSASGNWQAMVAVGAVPAIILGVGILTMPESPRWLALNHREEEARSVLKRIRPSLEVDAELDEIKAGAQQEKGSWRELFAPVLRGALIVGVGLGLFQQFTGINTVIYYAPTIFKIAGFESNTGSIFATAGVGLVNVFMTIVGLALIDRLGRRPLLLGGILGMGVALMMLAVSFGMSLNAQTMKLVGVTSLMLYVAAFAVSLGPIFWLIISEIYPLRIRGLAMSFATAISWVSNLVVSFTFPILLSQLGPSQTFALYAGITLFAFIFSFYLVPETKGLSLEQIEKNERLGASA